MMQNCASKAILKRLPMYIEYLYSLKDTKHTSATSIAASLNLGDVQVRKDLASVSMGGKPRVGYIREELIKNIEDYMGYNLSTKAALVGMGKLGKALFNYPGFKDFGIKIVGAFDIYQSGDDILSIDSFEEFTRDNGIEIGILTIPKESAQEICDLMVKSNIKAIWNFTSTRLVVPNDVIVKNENIATSLSILVKHMREMKDTE
ncbi:redox-sensing transcriptional repressor Rex [Mycoplasmatota bacterium WC30]